MTESQRRKFMEYDKPYICIGICNRGEKFAIEIPWRSHAGFMNTKTPSVYFEEADLHNPEFMARLNSLQILGCYIFHELKDYSFLENECFRHLKDLYIRKGKSICDLSFLKNMSSLMMLFLEDVYLLNLECLPEQFLFSSTCRNPIYLALANCCVEDISCLCNRKNVHLSELVIAGTGEEQRWRQVPAMQYTYYECAPE